MTATPPAFWYDSLCEKRNLRILVINFSRIQYSTVWCEYIQVVFKKPQLNTPSDAIHYLFIHKWIFL